MLRIAETASLPWSSSMNEQLQTPLRGMRLCQDGDVTVRRETHGRVNEMTDFDLEDSIAALKTIQSAR